MPPPPIVVNIVDEGYYKKFFRFSPTTNLKKPLDAYRKHVCTQCSDISLLEFWFETTKVSDDHTAKTLGMQNGDVIDVRISQPCTRGACPIPAEQTLPNIHYLATPPTSTAASSPTAPVQVEEQQQGPAAPSRLSMRIREPNGTEMVLTVRKTISMKNVMQAFAAQIRKQVKECRFTFEGQRIVGDDTPETLELEDGDLIEVFYEVTGGKL
ncbi:hypothetical protein LTR37_003341 [Vermiconidia calcicola]|uniref:Uncharacterized protein n=1 Tax=Vermiconidia calcicola TaxID=1690605 RepID=A0ACC3NQG8_9PEZI|nr:hypothetical protein LTR37_003341 [Vermiconidia calcicola]